MFFVLLALIVALIAAFLILRPGNGSGTQQKTATPAQSSGAPGRSRPHQ